MAAFLCFGGSSTLYGHVNAWTASRTSLSDGGIKDRLIMVEDSFSCSILLTIWVEVQQLKSNFRIHPLAQRELKTLQKSNRRHTGCHWKRFHRYLDEFTIAATLDSDQGIYGMSNLFLSQACGSSEFCRIQPADSNSDWLGPWSSTGNAIEGWEHVFSITPDLHPLLR